MALSDLFFHRSPGCKAGNRAGGGRSGSLQTLEGSAGWRLCSSECVGAEREAGELGKGTHTRPADCTVTAQIKVPTLGHHASLPSHPRPPTCGAGVVDPAGPS